MEKNYLKRKVFIPSCRHCQSRAKRQQLKRSIPTVVFQVQRKCYCHTLNELLQKIPEIVTCENGLYLIYNKKDLLRGNTLANGDSRCSCHLLCSMKSQITFACIKGEIDSYKSWFHDIVQFRLNHWNDCYSN